MRFKTLAEWLQWQEGAHPNAIDLGLVRVRDVALALGVLTPKATVVTVAGTNGKGSCVAALSALLDLTGKSYGSYTSPHIQRYNERVQFNGIESTDEELCAAFEAIDQARGNTSLTYFEFGTLAALYLFSQKDLDFWLLEVGLGGRLDAVNLIDSQLAIITSVDIDHVDWLGDNRESIGFEKAGICREGVPLICADPSPPVSVLSVASDLNCPLCLLNQDFGFEYTVAGVHLWGKGFSVNLPQLNLPLGSICSALQAFHILGLGDSAINNLDALERLSLSGRMQIRQCNGKNIVLDVAHNPAAMAHLALQLRHRYPSSPIALVVAMMRDKNLQESIEQMASVVDKWYLTTIAYQPRSAELGELSSALHQVLPSVSQLTFSSVSEALGAALVDHQSVESAIVVVTGSFYCVSEALEYIDTQCK